MCAEQNLYLRLQHASLPPAQTAVASEVTVFALDWHAEPAPIDQGVPQSFVLGLASAFCATGTVTFVSDTLGLDAATVSQRTRALRPCATLRWQDHGCYKAAIVSMPAIRIAPLALVETQQPDVAQAIFGIQAWHYAPCQAVCLTPPQSPSLSLDTRALRRLITQQSWSTLLARLRASGVQGVCKPSHHGGGLDCFFLDAAAARRFVAALHEQSGERGWSLPDSTGADRKPGAF